VHALLIKLQGGDRRSIGQVDQVVDNVLGSPSLFGELIGGLFVEDPVIRMRSADAVEKITLVKPDLLKPEIAQKDRIR